MYIVQPTIVSLDVGDRRIGIAIASVVAGFPRPLKTLTVTKTVHADIVALCRQEAVQAIVIGIPRSLDGSDTEQTAKVQTFGARLATQTALPIYWTDEAVTSRQAEAELEQRGKPYAKADIDALAATYILEDFIASPAYTTFATHLAGIA